ncbi:MAG: hypothetical protein HY868_19035 [Chloroflexi bacterium]|nr:hypothetical protein [Chloroflexota bacterium]
MTRRLAALVEKLRAADPDIVNILQFGSSVYAPRLARDVDLLVTTRAKKKRDLYWDAVESWDGAVDILVRKPGQRISSQIALAVLAYSKPLFGDGQTRKEAKKFMGVPTYDDARMYLDMADNSVEQTRHSKDERYRDAYYRAAFDLLFDAARHAAMTFLATTEKRWGKLPDRLPAPFEKQFREFISVLHVQYKYDGTYPKDQATEKYQEWRAKVNAFIDALAAYGQAAEDK